MDENTLYAARDPHGYRPLVLGRLASGWVVASETAALDLCGATVVREIEPGELISIDASGVHSRRFAVRRANTCVSSTCTWPALTRRLVDAASSPRATRWVPHSRGRTPSRRTW